MKRIIAVAASLALAGGLTAGAVHTADANPTPSTSAAKFKNPPEVRVTTKATAPRKVRVRIVGVRPDRRYSPGTPYRVAKVNDWSIPTRPKTVARGRITHRGGFAVAVVQFPKAKPSRKKTHYVNVYIRGELMDQQRVFLR